MSTITNTLNSLVSITQFNRGQASRIFDRLRTERHLIVLKNNQASAVIISPEEFERLSEIEENYVLLIEAQRRLEANEGNPGISMSEVMQGLGITNEEIDSAKEPVIE
ncbi:MAG: type II toxin-antitoxin system Phd/YefM family antitoxin [Lachnospiraceae bacterium]|nr:type II toxin-antitoxin system Phd/YefM family antitoxin [Lachnospiraceae bacterium]